nr:sensor histidine kinase [uncultured Cohaesibacter sp.]
MKVSPSSAPYSLRTRLLLWLLTPLGLIALLSLLDSYFSARQTANDAADRVLAGSVLAISERVFVNGNGELDVDIPYVALDMLTSAAQDRVFYRIDGPDNRFVTGYRKLPVPDSPAKVPPLRPMKFYDSRFRLDDIRIAVHHSAASSGLKSIPFRVSVAETTVARARLTNEILLRSAIRLLILILSAGIIVWFAVTWGLKPLAKLEQAIGRRSHDDLRPIEHTVPQEVNGLVQHINAFMAGLSGAIAALKHFTGNASHQIRTPLTIIRTQITVAKRAETVEEMHDALDACNLAIGDAERMISQMMVLARVDEKASQELRKARVDLANAAQQITMSFVPTASSAGFDLGYEGEDHLICVGDPVLIGELLKNLIDNAIKHAIGGDEITVRVTEVAGKDMAAEALRADTTHFHDPDIIDAMRWACLEVQDNGPGLPEDALANATRFSTKSHSAKGTGLGLAIIKEIAALFDGRMSLQPDVAVRGSLIRVYFPTSALAEEA